MIRAVIIHILLLLSLNVVLAQDDYNSISEKVSREDITRASKDIDYNKTKKAWVERASPQKEEKTPSEVTKRPKSSGNITGFFNAIFYIILAVLFAVILFGLFHFLSQIETDEEIHQKEEAKLLDEVEDIRDLNLDDMLARALEENNYKLAVRIKFLISLKSLTNTKRIKWSKDKTNRDYSRELSTTSFYREWQEVSMLFERVWYGDANINKTVFEEVSPVIDRFQQTNKLQEA